MSNNQPGPVFAFPLTFTDLITSLRQVLGLVDDAKKQAVAVSDVLKRQQGKAAAGHIDALAFGADGSRHHLEQIASGKGKAEDFDAISKKMADTGGSVEDAIDQLRMHHDLIRERFGLKVANKIKETIYASGGKTSTRMDLATLIEQNNTSLTPDQVSSEAQRIIANIQRLNEKLEELHDILVEIGKAS